MGHHPPHHHHPHPHHHHHHHHHPPHHHPPHLFFSLGHFTRSQIAGQHLSLTWARLLESLNIEKPIPTFKVGRGSWQPQTLDFYTLPVSHRHLIHNTTFGCQVLVELERSFKFNIPAISLIESINLLSTHFPIKPLLFSVTNHPNNPHAKTSMEFKMAVVKPCTRVTRVPLPHNIPMRRNNWHVTSRGVLPVGLQRIVIILYLVGHTITVGNR